MSSSASRGLLAPEDREWVASGYRGLLELGPQVEPRLRGVLDQILDGPGGLTRAQIAYGTARAFGADRNAARELAVGIEYLHTASLLFDDLPCMDDATQRRGEICPHRLFGEGPAVLAALALITRAYQLLWRAIDRAAPARRERAAALVASCLGLEGIVNGQALDLAFGRSRQGGGDVLAAAAGKTVALIRLTLVLPALLGGATEGAVEALGELAGSWGHAYQIVDDFRDELMGPETTGKTGARDRSLGRPNLPRAEGAEGALARARAELERAGLLLRRLDELAPAVPGLRRLFEVLGSEVAEIESLRSHRAVA